MRGKKSIDQLRDEYETALAIYQKHPSPFLFEKARAAKNKLDTAAKDAAGKKQKEVNQPTLL